MLFFELELGRKLWIDLSHSHILAMVWLYSLLKMDGFMGFVVE
jgi:hypothetical protein